MSLRKYATAAMKPGEWSAPLGGVSARRKELELELVQTHMAQKQLLRVEVGALGAHQAKNIRVRAGYLGANVQGACVGGCGYFGPGWASH